MSTEAFTGIGTGIAIIVVNITLFAWLRSDIHAVRDRVAKLEERMTQLETVLRGQMTQLETVLRGQMTQIETELRDRMATLETELRERMAKLEGLLEGLRESITGRRAA